MFFLKNNIIKWSYIDGYEGAYQVSNTGLVQSLSRTISLASGQTRTVSSRLLKQKDTGEGYKFVILSKANTQKSYYVHRLVAAAFVTNYSNNEYVNHIDGNPSNNYYSNLEWVSHGENVKHAYKHDLNAHKGANHTFSVGIIDNEIEGIFGSIKEWAEARGLNYNTARNILNGVNKTNKVNIDLIEKVKNVQINGKVSNTK